MEPWIKGLERRGKIGGGMGGTMDKRVGETG